MEFGAYILTSAPLFPGFGFISSCPQDGMTAAYPPLLRRWADGLVDFDFLICNNTKFVPRRYEAMWPMAITSGHKLSNCPKSSTKLGRDRSQSRCLEVARPHQQPHNTDCGPRIMRPSPFPSPSFSSRTWAASHRIIFRRLLGTAGGSVH